MARAPIKPGRWLAAGGLLLLLLLGGWSLLETDRFTAREVERDGPNAATPTPEPPELRLGGSLSPEIRRAVEVRERRTEALADLHALQMEMDEDWERNLALIEGTRGKSVAVWNRRIAVEDDLYRLWLEASAGFRLPLVGKADLELMVSVQRLLRAHRLEAAPGDAGSAAIEAFEAAVRNGGHAYFPLLVLEELLPKLRELLRLDASPNVADRWTDLAVAVTGLVRDHHRRPDGPFTPLLRLHDALADTPRTEVDEENAETQWARHRRDFGRTLLAPGPLADDDWLARTIENHPGMPAILAMAASEIERVAMQDVRWDDLLTDGAWDGAKLVAFGKDHADRCLHFALLIQYETPYGTLGFNEVGGLFSISRLYLLTSAVYRRWGRHAFQGTRSTPLDGVRDPEIEDVLRKRFGDLDAARKEMSSDLTAYLYQLVEPEK